MKKKICMVTTSPLDYDTRILNEAGTLSKSYNVTVLTKNYPNLPHILKKTNFKFERVKYFIFWPHLFNIVSSVIALAIAAFKENPDIYHAHDLDGLLCAYFPARIKKKVLVYDSHELWSDLSSAKRMKIQGLIRLIEKILMVKVDRGITVCDSLAKILKQKYNKSFVSIHNYPKLKQPGKCKYDLRQEFPGQTIILHIGSVSTGRGVDQLIMANKFLPANFVTVFLGNFSNIDQLIDFTYKNGLENKVFFKPSVKNEEILAVAQQADMGVVLTENLSISYKYSLPNKLFQYIAAELPILGSNLPEQAGIILKNNIGLVAKAAQPRLIAKKIMEMGKSEKQKKFRQNLKGLAKAKYNWSLEEKKLLEFYRKISSFI